MFSTVKILQFGHLFKQFDMKVLAQFLNGALFECNIWHFQYKSQLENAKQKSEIRTKHLLFPFD